MAFANEVGIAEIRICVGDARPGIAMTKLCFCDGPERVAMAHSVLRGSARRSDRRRHDNLRTYRKKVGVAETGIQREEFLPAASVAEARRSKPPE